MYIYSYVSGYILQFKSVNGNIQHVKTRTITISAITVAVCSFETLLSTYKSTQHYYAEDQHQNHECLMQHSVATGDIPVKAKLRLH